MRRCCFAPAGCRAMKSSACSAARCCDRPRTPVRLNAVRVEPDEALLAFGPEAVPGSEAATAVMNLSARGDLAEAAAHLFGYLRALDSRGARGIAVMPVPYHGLGEAINDRLRRAAMGRT